MNENNRIKVCQFRGRNNAENPICYIEVERKNNGYYHVAFNGELSVKYNTLEIAKAEYQRLYGNWHDFKLLV